MRFRDVQVARFAEAHLAVLLEQAGYYVRRDGIEERFDVLKHLSAAQYISLGLDPRLRTSPDLFVADGVAPCATWQVEVKCRRTFDERTAVELYNTLLKQHTYWPNAYAVIMLLEPPLPGGRFHQDRIRIVRAGGANELLPSPLENLWDPACRARWRWERLPRLQDVFPRFRMTADNRERGWVNQQNADFVSMWLGKLAA